MRTHTKLFSAMARYRYGASTTDGLARHGCARPEYAKQVAGIRPGQVCVCANVVRLHKRVASIAVRYTSVATRFQAANSCRRGLQQPVAPATGSHSCYRADMCTARRARSTSAGLASAAPSMAAICPATDRPPRHPSESSSARPTVHRGRVQQGGAKQRRKALLPHSLSCWCGPIMLGCT